MTPVNRFFSKELAPRLDYLAQRWRDESQYEDWNDYVTNIKKLFISHPDIVFQSFTKRPFAVKFAGDGKQWIAKCSPRRIELLEVHP